MMRNSATNKSFYTVLISILWMLLLTACGGGGDTAGTTDAVSSTQKYRWRFATNYRFPSMLKWRLLAEQPRTSPA